MAEKANLFLRDYQKEIVFRVHEAWKRKRSIMVQMPTGTGKTHVLASIVDDFIGTDASAVRVLIVAHRVELVEQIRETLHKLKIENEKLKNDSHNFELIKVDSIQTISRRIDTLDFIPDLVVIDEAHHALAKTYRILWDKWPKAKFLGLTATPCRMNRSGFTDLFDVLVSSWSIAEFIRKGVLSAFDYVSIRPGSMEQRLIDSLQKRGADGDYQVKEMDEVLNRRPSIERLYRSVAQFANGKKGIVYAISIDHARRIAAYYNEQGIKTVAIDSKTPRMERKQMVEDFKVGHIQVMVNVDVFSEGFDCPDVEFVQMARPTLSLAKYLQQVGRGLRKSEGKETCMLIDNVGLCRVFGLPVQAWNWERMFRGELPGKGTRTAGEEQPNASMRYAASLYEPVMREQDISVGLVISHETLMEKLTELDQCPESGEKPAELKAWQDAETGLWGLRRGRNRMGDAVYTEVFDLKEEVAAVRFRNYDCGVVDETGKVIWKRKSCKSMRMTRNGFLVVETDGGKESYVDLCNLNTYIYKPEVKRYGKYELLKVGHKCYSRTEKVYVSQVDFSGLVITNKGYLLSIHESMGHTYCLLEGDRKEYYRILRWLADGSVVITDRKGELYRATKDGEKMYLGSEDKYRELVAGLDMRAQKELEKEEENKKRMIQKEYRKAVPYRAGIKWGLKVGERITVPPIYRNIMPPVGKYCAVEKNYSQWGIITIDGTVLVEPKYPEVVIVDNGTALITQVTGKKVSVKLK